MFAFPSIQSSTVHPTQCPQEYMPTRIIHSQFAHQNSGVYLFWWVLGGMDYRALNTWKSKCNVMEICSFFTTIN